MKEIIVPGANGRMGRLILEAAGDAAFGHTRALGSLKSALDTTGLDDNAVLIDFTSPAATAAHAALAAERGFGLLVGTTGYGSEAEAALAAAAAAVPVLIAPNTSLGANLLFALTEIATRALPSAEAEIVELHHRHKRDAPSGTAIRLAESVARARAEDLKDIMRTSRQEDALRQPGEVGVFGVRGGTVPGEHTVYFFLDDERVELTHRVTDRAIFARGAVTAARWLAGKPAGHYTMKDVLGL